VALTPPLLPCDLDSVTLSHDVESHILSRDQLVDSPISESFSAVNQREFWCVEQVTRVKDDRNRRTDPENAQEKTKRKPRKPKLKKGSVSCSPPRKLTFGDFVKVK
jgi:hypothetical protein